MHPRLTTPHVQVCEETFNSVQERGCTRIDSRTPHSYFYSNFEFNAHYVFYDVYVLNINAYVMSISPFGRSREDQSCPLGAERIAKRKSTSRVRTHDHLVLNLTGYSSSHALEVREMKTESEFECHQSPQRKIVVPRHCFESMLYKFKSCAQYTPSAHHTTPQHE